MFKSSLKILLFTLTLINVSCGSEELTKRKAGKIIESRLDEVPFFKYGKVPIKFTTIGKNKNDVYFKYAEKEIVELKNIKSSDISQTYSQDLTNSGRKYLAEGYKYNGRKSHMVIYWEHRLKEVLEVHINPSTNTAKVKVIMERSNPTPFGMANIEKYKTKETFDKTYRFKKTTDGWIWNYSYSDYTK